MQKVLVSYNFMIVVNCVFTIFVQDVSNLSKKTLGNFPWGRNKTRNFI